MDEIIVKVPASHKGLAAALAAVVNRVVTFETQGQALGPVDYRAHEVALADDCGRIEREAHAISLASLDVNRPRIWIDGALHYRVGRYPGGYKCRTGEVQVMRSLYRKAGGRTREGEYAAAVNTVSLRSGAIEGEWLPETASAMAHRVARGTSREAAEASPVEHTLPYSRSSFERVGHAVGAAMQSGRIDIEEALIAEVEIPAEARSVSVAMDRTTLRMEEPMKRPVGRPRNGAPKRPVAVMWRMAWTATVTLHDEHGEALSTIRYGRMPHEDGESLAETIASDALALKQRRPDLRIVTLGDGGADVQGLLERHVDEETFGCRIHRLIDFWHVIEKLAAAAAVIASSVAHKDELVAEWRRRLCVRSSAPSTILEELRASGQQHVTVGKAKPVHEAITYFENQAVLMTYPEARDLGLPIGSGNVEATCKSLFGLRLKRPGARWHDDTGGEVVIMRAHQLSNRWKRATELALPPPRVEIRRAA